MLQLNALSKHTETTILFNVLCFSWFYWFSHAQARQTKLVPLCSMFLYVLFSFYFWLFLLLFFPFFLLSLYCAYIAPKISETHAFWGSTKANWTIKLKLKTKKSNRWIWTTIITFWQRVSVLNFVQTHRKLQ